MSEDKPKSTTYSVTIGSGASNLTTVIGDKNVANVVQTQSPATKSAEDIDIHGEFIKFREQLSELEFSEQDTKRVNHAMEGIELELQAETPDKDEVGRNVERVLQCIKSADSKTNAGILVGAVGAMPVLENIVTWLGGNWNFLLNFL